MKKKKQQIKFVSVQSLLWFVVLFFSLKSSEKEKFLLSVVCLVALQQRVWEEKGRCSLHCPAKKRYKNKGVTDTRIITSIVTRRRRKTRKKTKRGRKKT